MFGRLSSPPKDDSCKGPWLGFLSQLWVVGCLVNVSEEDWDKQIGSKPSMCVFIESQRLYGCVIGRKVKKNCVEEKERKRYM